MGQFAMAGPFDVKGGDGCVMGDSVAGDAVSS
jgi:hypothetical protein